LKPDYSEAWLELSREYSREKKWPQAVDAAKEAARLDPRNRLNWLMLGVACMQVNSYKEAIEAIQQGLRVPPDASSPPVISLLTVLGMAYSQDGDREHALEIYKKLKALDSSQAEFFFQRYVLPNPSATAHPKKIDPVLGTEAAKFKERIEEAIIEKGLTGRVKVQGTGNTLILTGKLRPAELGTLINFLRDAPASVRVVDQIEFDDAP
jgi:tetratricopeptide (TPR) repeat protein